MRIGGVRRNCGMVIGGQPAFGDWFDSFWIERPGRRQSSSSTDHWNTIVTVSSRVVVPSGHPGPGRRHPGPATSDIIVSERCIACSPPLYDCTYCDAVSIPVSSPIPDVLLLHHPDAVLRAFQIVLLSRRRHIGVLSKAWRSVFCCNQTTEFWLRRNFDQRRRLSWLLANLLNLFELFDLFKIRFSSEFGKLLRFWFEEFEPIWLKARFWIRRNFSKLFICIRNLADAGLTCPTTRRTTTPDIIHPNLSLSDRLSSTSILFWQRLTIISTTAICILFYFIYLAIYLTNCIATICYLLYYLTISNLFYYYFNDCFAVYLFDFELIAIEFIYLQFNKFELQ